MSPTRSSRKRKRTRTTFDTVRTIARGLPESEETTSYGTPAFRVRGKLFARLHQDGESLVVRAEFEQREALLESHPGAFFVTDHYRRAPWLLVCLGSISRALLGEVLQQAWRERAPRRLIQAFEDTSRPMTRRTIPRCSRS